MKNKKLWIVVILGICLLGCIGYQYYHNGSEIGKHDAVFNNYNILFGTDIPRVFNCLTDISPWDNRTIIHPLFTLFFNKIGIILSHFTQNHVTIANVMTSFAGVISVILIFILFMLIDTGILEAFILALVYGLTASQIFYSAIPETYIFAADSLLLGLILYCLAVKGKTACYYLLPISGVFTFGITITNIMQTCILTIGLMIHDRISQNDVKKNLQRITVGFVLLIAMMFVLMGTQKIIYTNITGYNYVDIIKEMKRVHIGENAATDILGVPGAITESRRDIMSKLNIGEISKTLALNFGSYSFLAPVPDEVPLYTNRGEADKGTGVIFSNSTYRQYTIVQIIALLVIWSYIIYGIYVGIKYKKKIGIVLLVCLGFNLLLHSFYGTDEAFIFAEHFMYIFVLFMGMALSKMKEHGLYTRIICMLPLIFVLFVQIQTNSKFVNGINMFLNNYWG